MDQQCDNYSCHDHSYVETALTYPCQKKSCAICLNKKTQYLEEELEKVKEECSATKIKLEQTSLKVTELETQSRLSINHISFK